MTTLNDNTLILLVHFRSLGNRRKVDETEYDVGDADKALVRATKKLIDHPAYLAIMKLDSRVKRFLFETCLPSGLGPSTVRVPVGLVSDVVTALDAFALERKMLVEGFVHVYAEALDNAAVRLGHLFKAEDYPEASAVRTAFGLEHRFVSFDVPDALQAIDGAAFAIEREKARHSLDAAVGEVRTALRMALLDLIQTFRAQLGARSDGKKGRLYASTALRLQQFLQTFELRNVTDDADLAAQVGALRAAVDGGGLDVDVLRDADGFRAALHREVGAIEAALAPLVTTGAAGRAITFEEVA